MAAVPLVDPTAPVQLTNRQIIIRSLIGETDVTVTATVTATGPAGFMMTLITPERESTAGIVPGQQLQVPVPAGKSANTSFQVTLPATSFEDPQNPGQDCPAIVAVTKVVTSEKFDSPCDAMTKPWCCGTWIFGVLPLGYIIVYV